MTISPFAAVIVLRLLLPARRTVAPTHHLPFAAYRRPRFVFCQHVSFSACQLLFCDFCFLLSAFV
jgi:hypothetical protein